jgi:hypothetical protein
MDSTRRRDTAREPVGTRRIYRVNADGVGRLRADLDRFWSSALAAYRTLVEVPNQQEVS